MLHLPSSTSLYHCQTARISLFKVLHSLSRMFAPRVVGLSVQVARTGLRSTSRVVRAASISPRIVPHQTGLQPFANYSSVAIWPASGPSSSSRSHTSDTASPTALLSIGHLERHSLKSATPATSILGQIAAFSSSTRQALRESYFRRPNGRSSSSGSGPGGSGRGGPGWFQDLRRRIDRLPPMYVIYGIIGANIGIFLVWQYAQASWVSAYA
jgi:hypothetical protein